MNERAFNKICDKYVSQIETLVRRNLDKYKYVGEEGKEFEVLQSIFLELNKLAGLSNKQIRWYAAVFNLLYSFRRYLDRDDPYNPFIMGKFKIPSFIGITVTYIHSVSMLGILASAEQEIHHEFVNFHLRGIYNILATLLEEIADAAKNGVDEDVYYLAIKQATDNIFKLEKLLTGSNGYEIRSKNDVNWDIYEELIVKRVERLDEKKLRSYYNMEAFWNGFVNGEFIFLNNR